MAVFAVAVRQDDASPPDPLKIKQAVQAVLTLTFDENEYSVPLEQIAVTVSTNATSTLASYASSLGAGRRLSETNATAHSDWAVTVQAALTLTLTLTLTVTVTLAL